MSDLMLRKGSGAPPSSAKAENFRSFFELFGRLSREKFLELFPMPFLMTQANTDPQTWGRARIFPIAKRSTEGKIAIASEGTTDDPEAVLAAQRIVVGRDPGCDIVLPLGTVSKRHAVIQRRDLHWWVTDLKSSNGTLLEGQELTAQRPSRIQRSPARLSFGPDAILLFFKPETLYEFIEHIRKVHGIEEPAAPVTVPAVASPVASPEDFESIRELPLPEDEAFSRVITLSRGKDPKAADAKSASEPKGASEAQVFPAKDVPAPSPTGKTAVDPMRGTDDERFASALRAIEALGDTVQRLEVSLDVRTHSLELFNGGTVEELTRARSKLLAYRPRIVALRVTSSLGDPVPYEIYVRR